MIVKSRRVGGVGGNQSRPERAMSDRTIECLTIVGADGSIQR
jgi:hypothetical protein